jgi:hypothetical protein
MPKSPQEMKAAMIEGLQEKTGRPLEDWLQLLKSAGLSKHKEMMGLLKTEHGLSHGYANMIALQALGSDSQTSTETDDLVDAQYGGAKAALRPTYDAVIAAVKKFGSDVEVSPKKAYVSLRRSKQFAIVQPSTSTRVDIGLVLPGVAPAERLEAAGSFNAMMSHRIRIGTPADVDKKVVAWLKQAYEQA